MCFLQFSLICINTENKWEYMVRNSLCLSLTNFCFLKIFKFLQCYHQAFIVFHCLGYWNEFVSDWHQLFKVFSKEFLFFCYFEKMNDVKHAFGTSSWIKNSGSIDHEKNHRFLDKSIYFWLAFESCCFHGHA